MVKFSLCLRRMAKKLKREGKKLSLIVVDDLQLLSATTSYGNDNRAMEVAAISRGLKSLVREFNVPVVAGSGTHPSMAATMSGEVPHDTCGLMAAASSVSV